MKEEELDHVFSALADPTRRRIIETVRERNCTVAELSSMFSISLPAVSKHLKVLDRAELLKRERKGKFIYCSYNGQPLADALQWIAEQQRFWKDSFTGLEDYLNNLHNGNTGK